jgi:hypothetical protein
LSWNEPVEANRTPSNIPIPNQQAFTASIAVSSNGTVAVAHSEFRYNGAAEPL